MTCRRLCLLHEEASNCGEAGASPAVGEGARRSGVVKAVAGYIPDEVIQFSSIRLITPAAPGPGVHSASNRRKKFPGIGARPVRWAYTRIAIREPTV
jgi:hypothetical protein